MVTALQADPHPVILRAPSVLDGTPSGYDSPPAVFERTDQNFLDAIYAELSAPEGLARLRKTLLLPAGDLQPWTLHPPMHNAFYVAMMEMACETYATPRYDPAKIASAGIVVRRVKAGVNGDPLSPERLEGWMWQGKTVRGWAAFDDDTDLDSDPDPALRTEGLRSGNIEINRRLVRLRQKPDALSEFVSPAFVAPPDLCQELRRTLVFGIIPVSSFEASESEAPPPFSDQEVLRDYPAYFRAGGPRAVNPSGTTLTWESAGDPEVQGFLAFVRQVAFEYGAFGEEPEAVALLQLLNRIDLDPEYPVFSARIAPEALQLNPAAVVRLPAGEFLRQAFTVLVEQRERFDGAARSITMPSSWPAVSQDLASRLLKAVKARMQARVASLAAPIGRFEDPRALYRARMFVRTRELPECPARVRWSQYTTRFRIAPWYENGGRPLRIPLPDLTSDSVKNLKPNVTFQVPQALFDTLAQNSPGDFINGNAQEKKGGPDLGWMCSFNLPSISLCAFIVLNIFLQLFNIIFQWMQFIKVCIPYPKPKS